MGGYWPDGGLYMLADSWQVNLGSAAATLILAGEAAVLYIVSRRFAARHLPEMAFLPDEERGDVTAGVEDVFQRAFFRWVAPIGVFFSAGVLGLEWIRLRCFPRICGISTGWWIVIAPPLAVAAMILGPMWLARAAARRVLRQELAKRGIPICVRCGYDLRGRTGPRCPECGEKI